MPSLTGTAHHLGSLGGGHCSSFAARGRNNTTHAPVCPCLCIILIHILVILGIIVSPAYNLFNERNDNGERW